MKKHKQYNKNTNSWQISIVKNIYCHTLVYTQCEDATLCINKQTKYINNNICNNTKKEMK